MQIFILSVVLISINTSLAISKNEEKLDKLMEPLGNLKKNQESLQITFDSKLEKLRNEVVKQ